MQRRVAWSACTRTDFDVKIDNRKKKRYEVRAVVLFFLFLIRLLLVRADQDCRSTLEQLHLGSWFLKKPFQQCLSTVPVSAKSLPLNVTNQKSSASESRSSSKRRSLVQVSRPSGLRSPRTLDFEVELPNRDQPRPNPENDPVYREAQGQD